MFTLTLIKHNCDAAEVFILLLRLTYELVLNFISCQQLVGLGGLHREADDLIGLFDLGQCYLGHGWQVLEAGVKKGVGGMTWERRSDLLEEKRKVILGGKSTFMLQLLREVRLTNLCDFVLWNCLKVGRGKCEAAVSSCIVWEKLQ